MKRRLVVISLLFGLLFVGVTARLVALQVVERDRWTALAKRIQERDFVQAGARGRLLDRNGVLLASDVPATSIALDNYHMTRPEVLLDLLERHLDLSRQALAEKIYKEGYFTWIARQVDYATATAIRNGAREAGIVGLLFVDEPRRVYPQGALASNVIGFTGVDHHGLEGAELAFDALLGGSDTNVHVQRTAFGTELVRQVTGDGGAGKAVVLTLDARIQRIAEQKLDEGIKRFRAKDGFVVVLNPKTGELLAMAQRQRYDLNRYRQSTAAQRLNQAVARAYEPGSLFKVFSGLSALENNAVSLSQTFDGDTKIRVAGHAFGNAEDDVKFGQVTLKQIIQNSINIGMIQVAQRVGKQRFYDYLKRVGFGRITHIELPGELNGTLIPLKRWSPLELGSISIGQAVSVTGIQLASKLAALGNGGKLMQPSVLLEVRDPDGTSVQRFRPRSLGRIATASNVRAMVNMMEAVVKAGTGTAAQLDGFSVAAKSGTAQKAVPGKGYLPDKFISSFVGFFPSQQPRFLILVVLDEVAERPVWGGRTAGSVFKTIAKRLIDLDKLYPDDF